jgi:mRNA-degrading endonuclease toxin of MazEF toxin-antitoxin module
MKQGEIYICDMEPVAGHEQGGKRPVVIISNDPFNAATGTPIVLPITSGGNFARIRGLAEEIIGCHTTGVIRCDQPRTLDLKARNGKLVDVLPADILEKALDRFAAIFD